MSSPEVLARAGGWIACAHCTLPVPPARVQPESERQFCCAGCETVFGVLRASGLERYYALRGESDAGVAATTTGRSFDELDEPAFQQHHVRPLRGGLVATELYLEGVHCPACLWLVERLPRLEPGVVEARLDLGRSSCRVTWDPTRASASAVARGLDRLGFAPHPFRGAEARELRRTEDRRALLRLAVAFASAANVGLVSVALYGGWLSGMSAAHESLLRWAGFAASLPALWAGGTFFSGAIKALAARRLHVDLPVAVGLAAGFAGSAVATVRGTGAVYFDSVTALVLLLLAGRWLQRRAQRSAIEASDLLRALAPSTARLVENGRTREVPLESLVPGSLVEVRAGDTIPVDGRVEEGRSELDLSLLSGESRPVPVEPGDEAQAGTCSLAGRILVRATRTGEETRIGQLMRTVEDRLRRRSPSVRLADRISGVFVAVVLVLAGITLAAWLLIEPAAALDHAIALLIVTCPCALALATPLAVTAALGRAARSGLLVKGGDALERLAQPGRVLLDKTGTLTEGRLALTSLDGDRAAASLAAVLERDSAHPIARAFVEAFPEASGAVSEARQVLGGGISGEVDGRALVAGSLEFARSRGTTTSLEQDRRVEEIAAEGATPIVVAMDGAVAAVAGFGDPVREDAAATVAHLRRLGARVGILSGDHPAVVRTVALRVGIPAADAEGGASPETKLARVEAARREGEVVMVGDGVNDAAALAAASVGVAVHGGAEASLQAADAFLTRPGIAAVAQLVAGSRRTVSVIRRGVAFSLAYNVVGAGLAMAGLIHPLLAALLMPASSLTVVLLAATSRTFREA